MHAYNLGWFLVAYILVNDLMVINTNDYTPYVTLSIFPFLVMSGHLDLLVWSRTIFPITLTPWLHHCPHFLCRQGLEHVSHPVYTAKWPQSFTFVSLWWDGSVFRRCATYYCRKRSTVVIWHSAQIYTVRCIMHTRTNRLMHRTWHRPFTIKNKSPPMQWKRKVQHQHRQQDVMDKRRCVWLTTQRVGRRKGSGGLVVLTDVAPKYNIPNRRCP